MKMNDLRKENHLSPDTIEKTNGLLAAVCTLLFYQIEPEVDGASPVLPSSLSRDS